MAFHGGTATRAVKTLADHALHRGTVDIRRTSRAPHRGAAIRGRSPARASSSAPTLRGDRETRGRVDGGASTERRASGRESGPTAAREWSREWSDRDGIGPADSAGPIKPQEIRSGIGPGKCPGPTSAARSPPTSPRPRACATALRPSRPSPARFGSNRAASCGASAPGRLR